MYIENIKKKNFKKADNIKLCDKDLTLIPHHGFALQQTSKAAII